MTVTRFEPEFVEYIPDIVRPGTLYVSMKYATATHLCACGCGNLVVTPFSPTDWEIAYDGETVTLWPSIGNWGFPCQSHYWIRGGQVKWAGRWTKRQIEAGRKRDRRAKDRQFEE